MRRRLAFATPAAPSRAAAAALAVDGGRTDSLRLFGLTYAAGFLFVSLLIA